MEKGTVVISLSGHDKGNLYVVLKQEENFLFVCDGKNKLISEPKKKNQRHLKDTGMYVDLSVYSPLYDAHIRKALKGLDKCIDSSICKK